MSGDFTNTFYLRAALAGTIAQFAYASFYSQWALVQISIIVNLCTMAMYIYDKVASKLGLWRIPEKDLIWFGLMGGWIGAIFARRLVGHKTTKLAFKKMFFKSIVQNIVIVGCCILILHGYILNIEHE